jgi:NitT/TauT family transport system substrate-binding protein
MRAYLRGVRDYNDALKDGRIAGPNADEIVAILTQSTAIKDPAVFRSIRAQGCNPDGRVHEPSLKHDLEFFKSEKLVERSIGVADVIDHSFVDWAVKELGPYKPPTAQP